MMNIRGNLSLLYDFYIVAKEKSFSKAADKNYVSQSNLSRSIKNLEDNLNLVLINRSNKGIELTKDGLELYNKLDDVFNNLNSFNIYNEELSGNLSIGTTRNIADNVLAKYLLNFTKNYPNIKVKVFTDNATNLNEYLTTHKIDVLIDYIPHINYLERMDISVNVIGEFNTCFACSKEFYEKHGSSIHTINDLNKYRLIIPGSSRRRQMLDEVLQRNNITLNPIIEMPDSNMMINMVKNDEYIGYFIENEIKDTDLQILNLKEELPKNSYALIYPKNTINNIGKIFADIVLDNIE